jgi:hypothetical protein
LSSSKGSIDLQYKISFDTLGTNKSLYTLNSTNKSLLSILDENRISTILYPSTKYNYYVASERQLNVKLDWESQGVSVQSMSKGFKYSNDYFKSRTELSSFISAEPFQYGTYEFNIKKKICNGIEYEDIVLEKYNVNGPLCFIYSAIMPGWGTRKVTYGEKGWGTTSLFLLSFGTSVGCLISGAAESNLNMMTVGAISGGLAGAIYLGDIFYVIGKGFKNLKNSAQIRMKLQDNDIVLKYEKIEVK